VDKLMMAHDLKLQTRILMPPHGFERRGEDTPSTQRALINEKVVYLTQLKCRI
jgi:predicted RNA methylase